MTCQLVSHESEALEGLLHPHDDGSVLLGLLEAWQRQLGQPRFRRCMEPHRCQSGCY